VNANAGLVEVELRENAACMAVMGFALANMAEPLEKWLGEKAVREAKFHRLPN